MSLPRLESADLKDKKVLLLTDWQGVFKHDTLVKPYKVQAILPTIEFMCERGAEVYLATSLTTEGDLEHAAKLLEKDTGKKTEVIAEASSPKNAPISIVKNPAGSTYDTFVNDSLSDCVGEKSIATDLPKKVESYAGFHLQRIVEAFEQALSGRHRPTGLILGGTNLANKMKIALKLMTFIDVIGIGGGLAYTFLKSRAIPVGNSLVDSGLGVQAFQLVEKAELNERELILPLDHVVTDHPGKQGKLKTVAHNQIPDRWMAVDVGPKTVARYDKALKAMNTILWYGPLGMVENEKYQAGSLELLKLLGKTKSTVLLIGEEMCNLAVKVTGFELLVPDTQAATALLLGQKLPGIEALKN